MKEIFKIYNSLCCKYSDINMLELKLLSFMSSNPIVNDSVDDMLFKSLKVNGNINPISVIQLLGLVHQKKKEGDKMDKTDQRKHFGIYYTDYDIAYRITVEAMSLYDNCANKLEMKFLEPCSGVGIFVLTYIDYIFSVVSNLNKANAQKIIDNIYCADIDEEAINLLKKVIPLYISFKYKLNVDVKDKNYYSGNSLFTFFDGKFKKNCLKEVFGVKDGFDIILTNPPYKLLKENSNKYSINTSGDSVKNLVEYIKKNRTYKFNEGTLNYYKLFIEEIVDFLTNKNSKIGLLIPITLLNDRQSEKLRKYLIGNYLFSKIYIIPEKNDFFIDISQAFCFFAIDKSRVGRSIEINPEVKNIEDLDKKSVGLDIDTIKSVSKTAPIIVENEDGWNILEKINIHPKVSSFLNIHNLRGELDLTLDKAYITKNKTKYSLIRGANVSEFTFEFGDLYVDEDFIFKLNGRKEHILRDRLVCQQISNLHGNKRLKFTRIPANVVLGNSCNYICKKESLFDNNEVSLDYLLGVFNSLLLDWRFKITNSNNHISNYEIAELPIVIPDKKQKERVEDLVKKIREGKNDDDIANLNIEIFKLYHLTKKEVAFILGKYKKENYINMISNNLNYAL